MTTLQELADLIRQDPPVIDRKDIKVGDTVLREYKGALVSMTVGKIDGKTLYGMGGYCMNGPFITGATFYLLDRPAPPKTMPPAGTFVEVTHLDGKELVKPVHGVVSEYKSIRLSRSIECATFWGEEEATERLTWRELHVTRAPREVTTVEELEALPVGAVLRDGDGDTWVRGKGGYFYYDIHYGHYNAKELESYGPFTVLYETGVAA